MNGRDKLLDWERLWSNIVQEEIRRNTRDGLSARTYDEESFARKGKKSKGKKVHGKTKSSQNGGKKMKDLSKIKFFHCHEFGHYATKCPNKKSNKHVAAITGGESLSSQFKLEFSLIACMECST